MNYKFQIVGGAQGESIAVFYNGVIYNANDGHPNFERIRNAIHMQLDAEKFLALFDTGQAVRERFNAVSDRVQVTGNSIVFDGQVVNNTLTKHIVRSLDEGNDNFAPFINFLIKVESNPVFDSREHLWRWLESENFTLTDEGNILGYKSVYTNGAATFKSVSSGTASVNGKSQTGQIVQSIGDTVTMPRAKVTLNPSQACSHGLHVGTYGYASDFSGDTILEVVVDPADVVSVPHDCSGNKMRVCRYVVKAVSQAKHSEAVAFDDDNDDDECCDCGCEDWDCICY